MINMIRKLSLFAVCSFEVAILTEDREPRPNDRGSWLLKHGKR